jgi:hypothetical protein
MCMKVNILDGKINRLCEREAHLHKRKKTCIKEIKEKKTLAVK